MTNRAAGQAPRADFRPDIEGLRAVAVVLVLLYHASVPGVTGGYIGVDVFFVLSGFLITGLLVRELEATGTISLAGFYARRVRRLLPAAMLLILATVVASVLVLSPLRAGEVAQDGIAAALYASNLRFAFQATDYLQSGLPPSPLLHLWSLGVEEQFYLFWPALLLLVTRGMGAFGAARPRSAGSTRPGSAEPARLRRIALLAIVVTGASFALSLWLTTASEPWAFFSLPTRAWELGIGAILAVGAGRLARLPAIVATPAGWLGLGMIATGALVIDTATPFPGLAALLPTVGCAMAMLPGMRGQGSVPARLLGWAPARFMGRISYSLYLWHWPLLVLPLAVAGGTLPLMARVGLMVLAVPIAYASQHWLEDPIRHGRIVGIVPRRNLALAGAVSLAVATTSLGLGFATTQRLAAATADVADPAGNSAAAAGDEPIPNLVPGTPSPRQTLPPPPGGPVPAGLTPSLEAARNDQPKTYTDGCHLDQPSTTIPDCVYGDRASSTVVVLFGDSHAAEWFPALARLAAERDWRLVSLTKSGCTPAQLTIWNANFKRTYDECDRWREAAVARIGAEHPTLVIVGSSHPYTAAGSGGPAQPDGGQALRAGLTQTLERLRPLARAVVLIGDTPKFDVDPPDCLSQHLDNVLACAEPRAQTVDAAWLDAEASLAAQAGATFVDPTAWACPTDPCPVVIGRYLVFRDQHHLATPFVTALRTRLAAALPLPAG
ncbi:MAG TPA: acyltransferase family protein [Candidatus Limnocylindrales bacterium]